MNNNYYILPGATIFDIAKFAQATRNSKLEKIWHEIFEHILHAALQGNYDVKVPIKKGLLADFEEYDEINDLLIENGFRVFWYDDDDGDVIGVRIKWADRKERN